MGGEYSAQTEGEESVGKGEERGYSFFFLRGRGRAMAAAGWGKPCKTRRGNEPKMAAEAQQRMGDRSLGAATNKHGRRYC